MKRVLQAGRALAAISVLVYHLTDIMTKAGEAAPPVLRQISANGMLGVSFFFVLSGFIILMAHELDIGCPDRLAHYGWRRFARIYPIYWICLTVYLLVSVLQTGLAEFQWDFAQLFSAYGLWHVVPQDRPLPLRVSWTLFYEIQFYAVFATLIVNRRLGTMAMAAWAVWIVGSCVAMQTGYMALSNEVCCLQFLAGMGAYWLYKHARRDRWPLLLSGGLFFIAMYAVAGAYDDLADFDSRFRDNVTMVSLAFAALLAGLVMAEDAGRIKVPGWLALIGNASYAIYLVHGPLLSSYVRLVRKFGLEQIAGFWPLYLAGVAGGIGAGCLVHIYVEKPLLARLRTQWIRHSENSMAASTAL